jgi:hypothetical protein
MKHHRVVPLATTIRSCLFFQATIEYAGRGRVIQNVPGNKNRCVRNLWAEYRDGVIYWSRSLSPDSAGVAQLAGAAGRLGIMPHA